MKKLFLVTLFIFFGSVFLIQSTKALETDIIISEICPTGCATTGHQWIEIHNKGTEPISLENWKFWENKTNHGLIISSSSQQTDWLIEPNEYAIIAQNDANFIIDHPEVSTTVFDSSWSTLNKSGEEIGLKKGTAETDFIEQFTYLAIIKYSLERNLTDQWIENPTGNTVGRESYVYSTPAVEPGIIETINSPTSATTSADAPPSLNTTDGRSTALADQPAGEATTTTPPPSPAEALAKEGLSSFPIPLSPSTSSIPASLPTTQTPIAPTYPTTGITINQFLSDPPTGEKEWIELYNETSQTVDLTDYLLYDGVGKIATISSAISSHSYLVITLNSSKLNNSGDTIILKNPDGVILDQLTYGDWGVEKTDSSAPSTTEPTNNIPITPLSTFHLPLSPILLPSSTQTIINQSSPTPTKKPTLTTTKTNKTALARRSLSEGGTQSRHLSFIGFVAVLPDIFGSQYFYLIGEDSCGYQIYQNKKDFPDLIIGNLVSATGETSIINEETRIKIKQQADIQVLNNNTTLPEPITINSIELTTNLLGCLVRITGEITEIKSTYLYLDDDQGEVKVYFKTNSGIDSAQYILGNRAEITGIVSGVKTGVQILPRSADDILTIPPDTTSSTALVITRQKQESHNFVKKYLIATVGGITTLLAGFATRARGLSALQLSKRLAISAIGLIKKKKD